ncbi:4-hydroxythreonine-4-phosphate dehydrogenase [Desulfamplus magnetovallimortis]|uniref:4-hydroxythreonine-4-phosphate dehydrogenase n=1 Tax=Desulfamplus magnetovallimortis TaxID=1246637 RepID=A0A1W1HEU5_9BACT|nr:4-hydroxythreonine-4-phosphate dehydrogenase PdxA [Desulfamplus magnetovallimortis]SLM30895.1 4-hydroxythreonine-4-phosphate dehydrogenase [Desulfamplus magnetovallimortis]
MKPLIGITLGDPAGIGSEITIKMYANEDITSICRPIVIGSKVCLEDIKARLENTTLQIKSITNPEQYIEDSNIINIIDLNNMTNEDLEYGKVSRKSGRASGEYIEKAINLAMDKKIDAIITNPIHKESFKSGGYGEKYAGHTEMLADLTGTKDYTMMLVAENLRIVHVTTHVSLRHALDMMKKKRILSVIKIANEACQELGIKLPHIGVAGINPHCGDGGMFGTEEIEEIIPAVEEAKALGFNVTGPVPADTVFAMAKGGGFDVVVAMYHDQGHIPCKTIGFQWGPENKGWGAMRGVNITFGLPIIRTSVDHGTAFGKAGKGKADYHSLWDAVHYAIRIAANRAKNSH